MKYESNNVTSRSLVNCYLVNPWKYLLLLKARFRMIFIVSIIGTLVKREVMSKLAMTRLLAPLVLHIKLTKSKLFLTVI